MAWLPPTLRPDHAHDPVFLGLPLIGRELGILVTGASGVLAGQYFFLHGKEDPRWLVGIAVTVLVLTFTMTAILMEVSWLAQMMPAAQLRIRFMWEYVAIQPMRGLTQALCQGYLIYRFYGLGRSSTRHRLMTAGFVLLCLLETTLDLTMTLVTILAWTQSPTSASLRKSYENSITLLYMSTLFLATLLNSQLSIWFCWKLWTLRTKDEYTTQAIRFVIVLALACGLSTTLMTLVWALWFAIEKGDSFRLLVDVGPALYACEFFLSLMSREKIRKGLQAAQLHRNEKALYPFLSSGDSVPILGLASTSYGCGRTPPDDSTADSHTSATRGDSSTESITHSAIVYSAPPTAPSRFDPRYQSQQRRRSVSLNEVAKIRHFTATTTTNTAIASPPVVVVAPSGWRRSRGEALRSPNAHGGSIVVHTCAERRVE